ncbi:10235_t:CDS:10 [Funneliformis geosporum]|uniref:10235_t:CDS:1 n=1 Tax=Funneliformis geosporum TaxID=1117311 RepID=A0A9W4SHS9_9GLOM|nr:10235_t:CDS:10 [Funneliformis geosporum]
MKNSWFSPPTDQKLTVNELKRKLEPYIVEGESHLRESLCGSSALPDDVLDISIYAEPKKQITFPIAVGTAGKGKTTFARKAYDKRKIYADGISDELKMILDDCLDVEVVETLFGKSLLYEALKYHLKGIQNFNEFTKPMYFLREANPRTHASSLFDSITSSGACIEEISLPLLSSERAQEVILDLANRDLEIGELIFLKKDKLVLPFLTLQQVYHHFDHSKLPAIKLLHDKKIIEGQRGNCWLSDLVPLWKGQSDKFIEFEPKFVVHSTPYRIEKDYWNQFFNNYSKELNKKYKQEVVSIKKEIIGHLPNILVVITSENISDFYEDILARMKLYSIGRS